MDESVDPATLQTLLNDPGKRVFCVAPGDYRAAGVLSLRASGTQQERRFLRFDPHDGKRNAVQRAERALFESIRIVRGSWWVIQGLTIQPRDGITSWFVSIVAGDHNILDGNLIDGIEHVAQAPTPSAVIVKGYKGDPATFNTLQANVVRNGDQSRQPGDYIGIAVFSGDTPGEDNDFNKILDNEIYDWGDGIQLSGAGDCSDPGVQRGTVIDGNDIYITGAKRIDCGTGAPNPAGECACAENAIDVKSRGGPDVDLWTRITDNRTWGFRPTSATANCGGSGANGQALAAGNHCAGHVLVARNTILDSNQGITVAGSSWIVAGNLIHDTRTSGSAPSFGGGTRAILPMTTASGVVITFNTVVNVDSAYDDQSANTATRCNAVIDEEAPIGSGGLRGTNHSTDYNFLYAASTENFLGNTNETFASDTESGNTTLCLWRRRWTAPERVCIPFANSTASSPHEAAVANCDSDLLAPFGIEPISYPSTLIPEPAAAWMEGASAVALAALAQRHRRKRQR